MDNFSPDFIIKREYFEDFMEEKMAWINGLEGVGGMRISSIFNIKPHSRGERKKVLRIKSLLSVIIKVAYSNKKV